ncbi:L-tyrosine/L-tryptophan isonitrile synthase family protein [Streptomyces sp. NPDC018031]|uniref:L-tyrosine/L-tryptophan isonitrile synthase family protein n=1 Tax=Streptomyces sp. NPDC018031 TaxID=3365033 RepID=UPI00379ADBA5
MAGSDVESVTRRVLELVLRHQRKAADADPGPAAVPAATRSAPCERCLAAHAGQVARAVAAGEPVRFVLPAFPGKSPNTAKVLGVLPDTAERVALEFLDGLCARIGAVHAPGARILICSDGRVFSDAVGIRDEHITAYQHTLQGWIDALPHGGVGLFTLDDLPELAGAGHDRMRSVLTQRYAEPLDALRERIRAGEEVALYRAITRFLFEDANTPEYTGSRAALQRDARARAYTVIQRSRAWGELLAERFPAAVRLSIHPQPCGAEKLGIHLVETADNWLTPWHSVALDVGGRFELVRRSEAERRGARLVYRDGRAGHYALPTAVPAPLPAPTPAPEPAAAPPVA